MIGDQWFLQELVPAHHLRTIEWHKFAGVNDLWNAPQILLFAWYSLLHSLKFLFPSLYYNTTHPLLVLAVPANKMRCHWFLLTRETSISYRAQLGNAVHPASNQVVVRHVMPCNKQLEMTKNNALYNMQMFFRHLHEIPFTHTRERRKFTRTVWGQVLGQ